MPGDADPIFTRIGRSRIWIVAWLLKSLGCEVVTSIHSHMLEASHIPSFHRGPQHGGRRQSALKGSCVNGRGYIIVRV